MSQRVTRGSIRRVALAGAGLALMMFAAPEAVPPASAAGLAASHQADAATAAGLTDVSAAKRKRRAVRRHYSGSSAAGMAFMGMAMGMIGSAIAESRRQDYYDRYYGPRYYYGPGPGYYGGRYYRRPYYGGY